MVLLSALMGAVGRFLVLFSRWLWAALAPVERSGVAPSIKPWDYNAMMYIESFLCMHCFVFILVD